MFKTPNTLAKALGKMRQNIFNPLRTVMKTVKNTVKLFLLIIFHTLDIFRYTCKNDHETAVMSPKRTQQPILNSFNLIEYIATNKL